jgi:hypothetical protein
MGCCAIVLDGHEDQSRVGVFTTVFAALLGSKELVAQMNLPYDFGEFLRLLPESPFNPTLSLKASKKPKKAVKTGTAPMISSSLRCILLLQNISQPYLAHLEALLELWDRNQSRFPFPISIELVIDDPVTFTRMDARFRARLEIKAPQSLTWTKQFNSLLVRLAREEASIPLPSGEIVRNWARSQAPLPAVLKELRFLLISRSTLPAASDSLAWKRAVFVFVSRLLEAMCLESEHIRLSEVYAWLMTGQFLTSAECSRIGNALKSLQPAEFVRLLAGIATAEKNESAPLKELKVFVSREMARPLEILLNDTSEPKSVDRLKDTQLDLIAHLWKFLRLHNLDIDDGKDTAVAFLSDKTGELRKAFDANPLTALQTALKHPVFYLNCKCCGSIDFAPEDKLTYKSLAQALKTINRPCLPDAALLYRLSLELSTKTVNLVEWFTSFAAIVGGEKGPLLQSRFFKAVHELQLVGMVSEFGDSKRKRRSVDRFNLTDSLADSS